MTAQNKKAEDDYYCVSLPPSEWRHIARMCQGTFFFIIPVPDISKSREREETAMKFMTGKKEKEVLSESELHPLIQ